MKARIVLSVLGTLLAVAMLSSCSAYVKIGDGGKKEASLPPGQAKKITGEQSAAAYAPGHNR